MPKDIFASSFRFEGATVSVRLIVPSDSSQFLKPFSCTEPYTKGVFDFDTRMLKSIFSNGNDKEKIPSWSAVPYENVEKEEIPFSEEIARKIAEGAAPKLDYSEFLRMASQYYFKFVFDLCNQAVKTSAGMKAKLSSRSPPFVEYLLDQDKLDVDFYMFNSRRHDSYIFFQPEHSGPHRLVCGISGEVFFGRLYAPYKYLGKIPSNDEMFMIEQFVSQAEFFISNEMKLFSRQERDKEILAKYAKDRKIPMFGRATVLFDIECNLHYIGKAIFSEKRNQSWLYYDLYLINKFKGMIERIAAAGTLAEAEAIYEDEFSRNNDSGEYYLGDLMCFFIGLAKTRNMRGDKENVQVAFLPDLKQIQLVSFRDLPTFLKKTKKFYFLRQGPAVSYRLVQELNTLKHEKDFICLYEQSCRSLGIPAEHVIADTNYFNTLYQNAQGKDHQ